MKQPKTHFAGLEKGNESNPHDYWTETLCGLDYTESPLSDKIEDVTCKKCLNKYCKSKQP